MSGTTPSCLIVAAMDASMSRIPGIPPVFPAARLGEHLPEGIWQATLSACGQAVQSAAARR